MTKKQNKVWRNCIMRNLTVEEKEIIIGNREFLHEQLAELQVDLLDMTNEELVDCRDVLLERVNWCMQTILETDEDNIE